MHTMTGQAVRRLARTPVFAAFAIVTLAIGIGVTTAFYAVVGALVAPPLGVPNSAGLVTIGTHTPLAVRPARLSWPDIADIAAQSTTLVDVAGFARFGSALSGDGRSEMAHVHAVSSTYFSLLGVRPGAGRTLLPADHQPGAAPVIVLSDRTWRSQFGGDPGVIGSSVTLAGEPLEVVGVAPREFRGVVDTFYAAPAAWVPLSFVPRLTGRLPRILDTTRRQSQAFTLIARLAPGAATGDAAAEITRFADVSRQAAIAAGGDVVTTTRQWRLATLDDVNRPVGSSREAQVILALPLLVLLVACTNLANLVVSRGVVRRYDLAVRSALGASRWRLALEELAEPMVIAVCGGLLGVVVTYGALWWAASYLQAPVAAALGGMTLEFQAGAGTWAVAAASTTLAVVVFGVVPALRLSRGGLHAIIAADNTIAGPRWRGRRNLIALQVFASVALSLLALAGQMYLGRDIPKATASSADLEQLALASIPLDGMQGPTLSEALIVRDIESEIRGTFGSGATAVMSYPPFALPWPAFPDSSITVGPDQSARIHSVGSDYFQALSYRALTGRFFDNRDTATSASVVILNERLALDVFGSTNVIGRTFAWEQSREALDVPPTGSATIIGVVSGWQADERVAFAPLSQRHQPTVVVLARGPVGALRAAIRRAAPDVALHVAGRADQVAGGFRAIQRFVLTTVGLLAAVVLILSMSGLYGVLSQVVAQRRREVGLRIALGAGARDIVRMVIRSGLAPVAEGCVIAVAVTTVLLLLLKGTYSEDISPPTFVMLLAVTMPLVALAVATCYVPARRAARSDPNIVLRDL